MLRLAAAQVFVDGGLYPGLGFGEGVLGEELAVQDAHEALLEEVHAGGPAGVIGGEGGGLTVLGDLVQDGIGLNLGGEVGGLGGDGVGWHVTGGFGDLHLDVRAAAPPGDLGGEVGALAVGGLEGDEAVDVGVGNDLLAGVGGAHGEVGEVEAVAVTRVDVGEADGGDAGGFVGAPGDA